MSQKAGTRLHSGQGQRRQQSKPVKQTQCLQTCILPPSNPPAPTPCKRSNNSAVRNGSTPALPRRTYLPLLSHSCHSLGMLQYERPLMEGRWLSAVKSSSIISSSMVWLRAAASSPSSLQCDAV